MTSHQGYPGVVQSCYQERDGPIRGHSAMSQPLPNPQESQPELCADRAGEDGTLP